MSDFFRGWKRRIGVLVLGIAGAFLGFWVRSFSTTDDHVTVWKNHSLYSHNGSVSWNVRYREVLMPTVGLQQMQLRNKSRWECCGIVISDFVINGSGVRQYWISDWHLISPLTALAAWLLLSKTRQRQTDSSAPETTLD